MNSVVSIRDFKDSRETTILVLVDLHSGVLPEGETNSGELAAVLDNCRTVLAHARALKLPVAFLRQTAPARSMLETHHYPIWIKGFEPRRSDMVFDRELPSCYSSPEFAWMSERTKKNFVLAGLSAEMSCLSTAVDAFHRRHQVTYLSDACYCGSSQYFAARELQTGVAAVLSLYGAVSDTHTWISMSTEDLAVVA